MTISRTGYIESSGVKKTQEYNLSYDAFGRRTRTTVGLRHLADYEYYENSED